MKIDFVLNYEEYRESQESRLKKADRSLLIGLLGVLIAASGISLVLGMLILQGPQEAHRLAIRFLIVGVLFMVAIPFVWRWRRERDVNSIESGIRADFEALVKEKQRTFEVDEFGWTFRSEYGIDVRPWATFGGFWKGDKVFTLSTRSNVYVLPKRAFNVDEFASLENQIAKVLEAASTNPIFAVRLVQSAAAYTLGAGSTHWQYRPTGILLLVGLLAAGAGLWWDQIAHIGEPGSDSFGLGLSIICLALAVWFLIAPLFQHRKYKELAETLPGFEAKINADTICIDAKDRKIVLKYEHFRKFRESRGTFLLYHSDKTFVMLPKQGFDKKRLNDFRDLLRTKLKPA